MIEDDRRMDDLKDSFTGDPIGKGAVRSCTEILKYLFSFSEKCCKIKKPQRLTLCGLLSSEAVPMVLPLFLRLFG